MDLIVIAAISVLIPLHVVEEWVFPGGFHYHYNTVMKSKQLDRYPMSRLTDMLTNFIATIFYVILTLVCIVLGYVPLGISIGTFFFCLLEVIIHTAFGTFMYFKFKSKGKSTIYGPGSITAYFGFAILGGILFYEIIGTTITTIDWFITLAVLLFILIGCILIPENCLKKENNDFNFESAGYYEKFL